jgi:putative transposase
MGQFETLSALNELEGSEAKLLFRGFMRNSVREALVEIMNEEVNLLCGTRHQQNNTNEFKRGGSEDGIFYDNGEKKSVKRPRVRNGNEEVSLTTYNMARDIDNISDEVLRAAANGVSSRGFKDLKEGGTISKSEFSRLWIEKGAEKLDELRSRDLSKLDFFALMLDGIHLSKNLVGIVALGITKDGYKHILDFVVGGSESYEVSKDLMKKITKRGLASEHRFFVGLDGSDALKKAVLEFFPDAIIQRCLIHKERNLHSYLSKKNHAECSRLISKIRKAQGENDGREALDNLGEFLKEKNYAAYQSLLEAGGELISLHRLEVPSTLNVSLLSTNIIENTMLNIRRKTDRNHRWRPETQQADRWLASSLLFAEKGFRRIKGYKEIPDLVESLKDLSLCPRGKALSIS